MKAKASIKAYRDIKWHDVVWIRVKVVEHEIADERETSSSASCDGYCTVDLSTNCILVQYKLDADRVVLVHEALHVLSFASKMIGEECLLQEAFDTEIRTYDCAELIERILKAYDDISKAIKENSNVKKNRRPKTVHNQSKSDRSTEESSGAREEKHGTQ